MTEDQMNREPRNTWLIIGLTLYNPQWSRQAIATYPGVDPCGSMSAYDLKYFFDLECFPDRDFSFSTDENEKVQILDL